MRGERRVAVRRKTISGIMLALLLVGMLTLAFNIQPVKAEPTTIVVPDHYEKIQWAIGNASDGDTIFVRAGTYFENVVVDKTLSLVGENRSNTIIDGNRNGIVVRVLASNAVVSNFTIRNGARTISNPMVIPGNGVDIGSSGCTITGNIITNNTDDGICIYSAYCTIVGNIIANNEYIGIEIKTVSINNPASGSILRDNSMINNTYNFGVQPLRPGLPKLAPFIQDIDTSNTVNGKPIYYWVNEHDKQVPSDAGYVAIINSTNITVKNLKLTNNYEGVLIAYSNNILIDSVNISTVTHGITIHYSHHNNISASTILNNHKGMFVEFLNDNTITDNTILNSSFGVFLYETTNNIVRGNTITASYSNIWVTNSHYNQICQNRVSGSSYSLSLGNSHNNLIEKNLITRARGQGVSVYDSNNNSIISNTMALNEYGIYFCRSTGNVIYHSGFINNTNQVFDHIGGNIYDNGYPSGGNYWSDYTGVDEKRGPDQDKPKSDGIGDTPYTRHNVEDRYPLMNPWGGTPLPFSYTLTIYSLPSGVTFTVDGVSHTTPWSAIYIEGASVSLVMSETHDGYAFSHWLEDEDTNRTKTVTMDTNLTLTVVYTNSTPVGGIYIPVNKLELLAQYIGLTILLAVAIVTVTYVRKRKRHREILS